MERAIVHPHQPHFFHLALIDTSTIVYNTHFEVYFNLSPQEKDEVPAPYCSHCSKITQHRGGARTCLTARQVPGHRGNIVSCRRCDAPNKSSPLYTALIQMSQFQMFALSSVFTILNLGHLEGGSHSHSRKPKMVEIVYCQT
ncbi:hypothetical protein M758_5G126700 [Ceratodon purpureus]|nr:hypothetical protein M758_5G126700 [Ceratodon purpureus]